MAAAPSGGRAARVEQRAAREADATRDLYERYSDQIFGYCLRRLGSREEAEDAVQSTFLNAFRGLTRGVEPEIEGAWLFKIAQNVCLSRHRSSWRRRRVESSADFEVVRESTPAPSGRGDELMGLQDALGRMPPNQRRALLLREWQGLSYREIAVELELSQAAVETLIFRARRALAHGLEEPPAPATARVRRGAALGNVAAAVKSVLLGGAAAVKVAATVAVVGGATVAASGPLEHHLAPLLHAASASRRTPPARRVASAPATSRAASAPAVAPALAPRRSIGRTSRAVERRASVARVRDAARAGREADRRDARLVAPAATGATGWSPAEHERVAAVTPRAHARSRSLQASFARAPARVAPVRNGAGGHAGGEAVRGGASRPGRSSTRGRPGGASAGVRAEVSRREASGSRRASGDGRSTAEAGRSRSRGGPPRS